MATTQISKKRKFVAELNEVLTRELAEDGYSVVEDFPKLKTIKLSNSHNLIETPDFTMVPNLEMLDLKGCTRLRKVHESVEVLKSLSVLNLEGCKNLQSFPVFSVLKSLKILNLQGCSKLDKFPENLEELEHLEELDVGGTTITQQLGNRCHIGLPGNEIPEWFSCRSDDNSVKIGLPPDWLNDEFMGIAMCGVLSLDHKDFDGRQIGVICIMDILGISYEFTFATYRSTTFESDHLWLAYESRELFERAPLLSHLVPWECEYDSTNSVLVSTSTCIHARYEVMEGGRNSDVIKSGIRLVYKGDIECSEDDILPATDASILYQHHNCSTFPGNRRQFCMPDKLQGNEIPKWFSCRSNDNSVKIGLPPNWLNDEFMGITMCGVFTLDHKDLDGSEIRVSCRMDIMGNSYGFNCAPYSFKTFESNYLWLTYVSREQFEHDRSLTLECSHLRSSVYEYDSTNSVLVSTSTCIHAGFEVISTRGGHLNSKANKSGIRLVYKRDIDCSEDDLPATDASILHQHRKCSTFPGKGSLLYMTPTYPSSSLFQKWWRT
ncbi:hypothetical protein LWI29_007608 [Acer saccharum]|uniref:C-JID domain-containing protein n=1 Tax=Acer saccharum TaxID=4024 RepID=A0AA39SNH5_ACESA|nr:hypothetical protein LWI29_007608 [Acer saccharum]